MDDIKEKLRRLLLNDWFVGFLIFLVFLLTHGYRYGWDDHHLEIPLLKHLIDNTLYPGDYYVASLKENFTTYFYPLLARLISIDQIPGTYFVLFCLSRLLLFSCMFKFWNFIAKDRITAFCCTVVIIVLNRIDEFLYLTFSHQEFALAFVFAGIYFFYKERFLLAAVILGIIGNFHAVYSLIPMIYMCCYLLVAYRKHGILTLLKTGLIYTGLMLPFLFWAISNALSNTIAPDDPILQNWVPLVNLATPEAFIFKEKPLIAVLSHPLYFLVSSQVYIFLILAYAFNCLHNKPFRRELKNHVIAVLSVVFLIIQYVAAYVKPSQFLLTLNLFRCTQFLIFFYMGYITLLLMNTIRNEKPWVGLCLGFLFTNLAVMDLLSSGSLIVIIGLLHFRKYFSKDRITTSGVLSLVGLVVSVVFFLYLFFLLKINPFNNPKFFYRIVGFALITTLIYIPRLHAYQPQLKRLFLIFPLALFMFWYVQFHFMQMTGEKRGLELLQVHWEDMQHFVKNNTPKDATLLVPYDMEMGGFRILSERTVICSDRDKNIVAFDFKLAREWEQRRNDIITFSIRSKENIQYAIYNAILKYGVDHIVFMTHYAPQPNNTFELLYANRFFTLFRINKTIQPDSSLAQGTHPETEN